MLKATKKQIDALIVAHRNYQNALNAVRYDEDLATGPLTYLGTDLMECMKPADLEQLARIVGVPVRTKKGYVGTIYEVNYSGCCFFWHEPYEKEVA